MLINLIAPSFSVTKSSISFTNVEPHGLSNSKSFVNFKLSAKLELKIFKKINIKKYKLFVKKV